MRDKPRREILIGDKDGLITVWDLKTQSPIYVLKAHTDVITQMKWIEAKQLLITCSKDKSIKVWKFPAVWIDESQIQDAKAVQHIIEQEEDHEQLDGDSSSSSDEEKVEEQVVREAVKPIEKVVQQAKNESDEDDDLTGWNN